MAESNEDNGDNNNNKITEDFTGKNVTCPPTEVTYAKPFPNVSKIEMFEGENFRRWQERVFSVLDVHGVAATLTDAKPDTTADTKRLNQWTYANKVCRHTILSTLSNDLFDVYCSYKIAKEIWKSMNDKYTAEDATKQKFVVGNYLRWQMKDDKEIKVQINEYHKLLEELKAENINLQDEFVAGALVEKLPESWNHYKQQLKHKHKQMNLIDLIKHIIIEDTSRKECNAARAKALESRANLIQNVARKQRYENKSDHVLGVTNPNLKPNKGSCFVCGKPGHKAFQCRYRKQNNNPSKPNANLAEGDDKKDDDDDDDDDDVIVAVISKVNIVSDVRKWVVDSGATRHICANRAVFTSYSSVGDGEDQVYLGDSRTAAVEGKGKVLLKLTSGKRLALSDVLHVPTIRTNLISVALLNKVGVKVSFESDKIIMKKNNIFVGKGYCDHGLFVLNVSEN